MPDTDRLHYMMSPRVRTIAEALSPPSKDRNVPDFRRRASHHMRILHRLGVHGRPLD